MKTIFLTALSRDKSFIQAFMQQMKPYGLDVTGHFWVDELKKLNSGDTIQKY